MEAIPSLTSSAHNFTSKGSGRGGRIKSTQVTLHRRTLADYPMDHDRKDALRMLYERRTSRAEQLAALQTSLGATRQLSANSRKRFLGVLAGEVSSAEGRTGSAEKDQVSSPRPTALRVSCNGERRKFHQGSVADPQWSRQRHNSIATSMPIQPRPIVQPPVQRPVSEPPRTLTPGGGRSLNHLRTCVTSYPPGLGQLLHDYNKKLRVECSSPPVSARPRPSEFRHCRLLPLVDEEAERRKQEEAEEEERKRIEETLKLMIPQFEGEGEAEEKKEEFIPTVEPEPSLPTEGSEKSVLEAIPEPLPEPASEPTLEVTPPFHCWVDDATVSSISVHNADLGDPEDPDLHPTAEDDAAKVAEAEGPQDGAGATKAAVPVKTDSQALERNISSPAPLQASNSKRKVTSKDRRKKEAEPVVLPEPPPPEPEPEVPVEEIEPEVVEEVVEPVLPTYCCPSSEVYSHMTETKRWLWRSSFSGASRYTPVL